MGVDPSRRFTDREVAIVLRRASEIDDAEGSGAVGGLTLDDLEEIAREVGISPTAIERAVSALDHGREPGPGWAGAPLVRKAVHAVPGELTREAMAGLVRVVDERTDTTGTISEALGSVRWTSSDRLKSSLVSLTVGSGETRIQVVEKAVPRVRRVFHLLPAAWAVMIAAPLIGGAGLGAAATAAAVAGSLVAGAAVGRGAWTLVSGLSARRVERLGSALAVEARQATERGLVEPAPGAARRGVEPDAPPAPPTE